MIAGLFVSMSEPEKRTAAQDSERRQMHTMLTATAAITAPFLILWQCIDDFVPGGFGTDEDVFAGTHTRITINRSQYHFGDLSGIAKTKRGAALPTKASLFSR